MIQSYPVCLFFLPADRLWIWSLLKLSFRFPEGLFTPICALLSLWPQNNLTCLFILWFGLIPLIYYVLMMMLLGIRDVSDGNGSPAFCIDTNCIKIPSTEYKENCPQAWLRKLGQSELLISLKILENISKISTNKHNMFVLGCQITHCLVRCESDVLTAASLISPKQSYCKLWYK